MTSIPKLSATAVSSVGTLIVGVLLWVSGAFTLLPDWGGHTAPVMVLILLGALALQLVAPRRPLLALTVMLVALALDFPSGISLPLWISFTDVLFVVMTIGSSRLRRAVGTGCFAVTFGGAVVVAIVVDPRAGVLAGLLGVAFLISPLGYAQSVHATLRATRAEQSAAQAEHAAALAQERRRVSRELHDTVAGHVSAIAILAEAAREVPDPTPIVASMRANSLAALVELRAMIDVLAGDGDEAVTVRWSSLAPLVEAARSVGCAVSITGRPDPLTTVAETVLTRIAGEALTNATRHAAGQPVSVTLTTDGVVADLTVVNGLIDVGATDVVIDGKGVRNMRIRAESVGGTASAGRVDDTWVVVAQVPAVPS